MNVANMSFGRTRTVDVELACVCSMFGCVVQKCLSHTRFVCQQQLCGLVWFGFACVV